MSIPLATKSHHTLVKICYKCDNALYTFMSAFTVVVSALEYLEADGDGKARN